MAGSDNTTSLPTITRRALLAGLAAVPAVGAIAAAPAVADGGGVTGKAASLAQAIDDFLALKAEDAQLDAQIEALHERVVAPAAQALVRAGAVRDELLAQLTMVERNCLHADGFYREIFRQMSDEGLSSEQAAEMSDLEIAARVGRDPQMIQANAACQEASRAAQAASEECGHAALVRRSNALSEQTYAALRRIDETRATSPHEVLRKIEIMASEWASADISFADFFDFIRPDLEGLQGAAYNPAPATATLERKGHWGPLGLA